MFGNFPNYLESYKNVWKFLRLFRYFPDCLKSCEDKFYLFQITWEFFQIFPVLYALPFFQTTFWVSNFFSKVYQIISIFQIMRKVCQKMLIFIYILFKQQFSTSTFLVFTKILGSSATEIPRYFCLWTIPIAPGFAILQCTFLQTTVLARQLSCDVFFPE